MALPKEIAEEAAKADIQRRTAGAVRAQHAEVQQSFNGADQQKQLVDLVLAHAAGKPVQVRSVIEGALTWVDDLRPTFTMPISMYRLKPEIREWYAVLSRDGQVTAIEHTIAALPRHDPKCRVHLREVTQEDE
jgi:hypothetical protein